MTDTTPLDEREEYAAGLEALARVIREHPELPLPDYGSIQGLPIRWVLTTGSDEDQRRTAGLIARTLPCRLSKDGSDDYFHLSGQLRGLYVDVLAYRSAVCRRVVTGTRQVTKKVKEPKALAAVPEIEVTETVEDVEWKCDPILADSPAVAPPAGESVTTGASS